MHNHNQQLQSARKKPGMGELCNDLLESPYIGKFAKQDGALRTSQSRTDDSQSELESSRTYSARESSRREESTLHTNPNLMSNGMLSHQAPSSKEKPPAHIYSVDNSNSMVMYNGTIRNNTTAMKQTLSTQKQDHTAMLSQGNQILFDSKAFDKMPSHLHQINSQTGVPQTGMSSNGHYTTLNNNPYSME